MTSMEPTIVLVWSCCHCRVFMSMKCVEYYEWYHFFLSIFHLFAISGCCCFFFIVFLTHTHNRLVSLTCTDYRSNADDSTLFNCCCRSMALLNFSIHVRMINQMIVVSIYSFFSPQGSTCPLLAICFSDDAYEQSTNRSYLIVFLSIYRNVLRVGDKKSFFSSGKCLENHHDNYFSFQEMIVIRLSYQFIEFWGCFRDGF